MLRNSKSDEAEIIKAAERKKETPRIWTKEDVQQVSTLDRQKRYDI